VRGDFVDIGGIEIISHLNSLSDGQQFHQYQKNHLSPQLID
jgi:hypothetical protein